MQTGQLVLHRHESEDFDWHDNEVLRVVVAYEDLAMAERAQSILEHTALGLNTGDPAAVHCAMWKISDFKLPSRLKMAAAKAVTADLIVVAAHERAEVPEVLQEWVGLWLPKKMEQSCGLMALLDHPEDYYVRRGIYRYLRCVAHCGNMAFFSYGREEDFGGALRNNAPFGAAPRIRTPDEYA